ncbi:phBC6A51 family helix-turn-helix protein [Paenibacillus senegalimassiliensis]|uniref:phBC6A51 family helix-turn-helix protein n=1 Tax=Paenibacillus senegalimassiliensis TaxID=1737426 RepID=UPI00073EC771|nr:phBC6A51 family helix-turn-helix protein [Paenibacillus senegalimassiliensis]
MRQTATESVEEQNLTRSEQALLEALLNPENRIKSVTDICKIAKVDRATYYRAFAKPHFAELYNRRSVDLVKQSVASVLNTFVREAQRGSFQHGKVVLEMAGVYTEKSDVRHSGHVSTDVEIVIGVDEYET